MINDPRIPVGPGEPDTEAEEAYVDAQPEVDGPDDPGPEGAVGGRPTEEPAPEPPAPGERRGWGTPIDPRVGYRPLPLGRLGVPSRSPVGTPLSKERRAKLSRKFEAEWGKKVKHEQKHKTEYKIDPYKVAGKHPGYTMNLGEWNYIEERRLEAERTYADPLPERVSPRRSARNARKGGPTRTNTTAAAAERPCALCGSVEGYPTQARKKAGAREGKARPRPIDPRPRDDQARRHDARPPSKVTSSTRTLGPLPSQVRLVKLRPETGGRSTVQVKSNRRPNVYHGQRTSDQRGLLPKRYAASGKTYERPRETGARGSC